MQPGNIYKRFTKITLVLLIGWVVLSQNSRCHSIIAIHITSSILLFHYEKGINGPMYISISCLFIFCQGHYLRSIPATDIYYFDVIVKNIEVTIYISHYFRLMGGVWVGVFGDKSWRKLLFHLSLLILYWKTYAVWMSG